LRQQNREAEDSVYFLHGWSGQLEQAKILRRIGVHHDIRIEIAIGIKLICHHGVSRDARADKSV
jgi:hypothetical protein